MRIKDIKTLFTITSLIIFLFNNIGFCLAPLTNFSAALTPGTKKTVSKNIDERFRKILDRVAKEYLTVNVEQIQKAYDLTKRFTEGHRRARQMDHVVDLVETSIKELLTKASISDPQEIADYLCGCLLHDVLEDWDEGALGMSMLREAEDKRDAVHSKVEGMITNEINLRVLKMVQGLTKPPIDQEVAQGDKDGDFKKLEMGQRSMEADMHGDGNLLTGEKDNRIRLFIQVAKIADHKSNYGEYFWTWYSETWDYIQPAFLGNRVPWDLTRSIIMIQKSNVLPQQIKADYLDFLFTLVSKRSHNELADIEETVKLFEQMASRTDVLQAGIYFFDSISKIHPGNKSLSQTSLRLKQRFDDFGGQATQFSV